MRIWMMAAAVLALAAPAAAEAAPEAARLGQLLFYDKVLSGNRNIACATCHHPRFGTSDGVSLGVGEGGTGLGPDRVADPANPPEQRIPRNAPALFNLGAAEFTHLFHDGRIEADPSRPSGLRTPLEDEMVAGFSGVLAAQTMFPVLSPDEMAGHYAENDVSTAVRRGVLTGPDGAWALIAGRVAAIPEYAEMFENVYPETVSRGIAFTDVANAIAEFIAYEWRADASRYDRALDGGPPLDGLAAEGLALFEGRGGCAACHAGRFQTDHAFHAMGDPQLGPGKAERFERHQRDVGRMLVTGRAADAYAFRTPSLRHVTETGPWGHAGAFDDLRAYLRHHADPVAGLARYTPQAVLPAIAVPQPDFAMMDDPAERAAIAAAVQRPPVALSEADLDALLAFFDTLDDPGASAGRLGVPAAVPSGLPVDR